MSGSDGEETSTVPHDPAATESRWAGVTSCFDTFAVTVVPAQVTTTGFGAGFTTTSPWMTPTGVDNASVSVSHASSSTSAALRSAAVFEHPSVRVVYTSLDWKIELEGAVSYTHLTLPTTPYV